MTTPAGLVLSIALVATHTGSCIYPRATVVDVPAVRGHLEDAGVVASVVSADDRLVVEFDDGRSTVLGAARHYLSDSDLEAGDLLVVGTAEDGDTLAIVAPWDEELGCFAAYSPARVRGDGLLLSAGFVVPLAPTATDELVYAPETRPLSPATPAPQPLTMDTVFYTHDAACMDAEGRVTGIRRSTYEGDLPAATDEGG